MKLSVKIFLTIVAFILILSGGVDAGITTVPGIAILGWIWGAEKTVT